MSFKLVCVCAGKNDYFILQVLRTSYEVLRSKVFPSCLGAAKTGKGEAHRMQHVSLFFYCFCIMIVVGTPSYYRVTHLSQGRTHLT